MQILLSCSSWSSNFDPEPISASGLCLVLTKVVLGCLLLWISVVICKFLVGFYDPRMANYCFSFVSMGSKILQRSFVSAGLEPRLMNINDETEMHCWVPRNSETHKQNVVFIHGFGPYAVWQWSAQVKSLSRNFNIYVPDLVFFGDSTTNSSERSEVFQAHCVMKLMKKLQVQKFSVVGTSYGGFVAYHMAHFFPEFVDKVVIASSAVCREPKDYLELLKRADLANAAELLLPQSPAHLKTLISLSVHNSFMLPMFPNFFWNDFLKTLYAENREKKVELLAGIILGTDKAPPLPVIKKDVLIIWGAHDQIFPVELAYKLKKHLGENAELVILEDAAHAPQIEKSREFNSSIKNFLLRDMPLSAM